MDISKLSEKISHYEFLVNLIPGSALCFILSYIGYPILDYNMVVCIAICYLVGLINGRFASLVIEGLCRITKFIKWKEYEFYIAAKEKRPYIEKMQEEANMFRSFVSVFFVSIIAYGVKQILPLCDFLQQNGFCILMALLFLLFLFSYRKQTNKYVVKNIDEELGNVDKNNSKKE